MINSDKMLRQIRKTSIKAQPTPSSRRYAADDTRIRLAAELMLPQLRITRYSNGTSMKFFENLGHMMKLSSNKRIFFRNCLLLKSWILDCI